MATKKPTKTEIMDIPEDAITKIDTSPIPTISVEIDTSDEALMPEPVPASNHLSFFDETSWWTDNVVTKPRKYENILPVVATVLASVVTGAVLIAVGILIGAGL